MSLILPALVQIALLVAGFKLWRWAKRSEKAARTRWRRRFSAAFFVSPMVFWLLLTLAPENQIILLLATANGYLDAGVDWTVGTAQEGLQQVGAVGVLAVKPVVRCVVYAALGALVGWPLDRLGKQKAEQED